MKHFLAIVLAAILLSGCGSSSSGPSQLTLLTPLSSHSADGLRKSRAKMVVAVTDSAPGLNSERIALVKQEQNLDYFADVRWAEPLPAMVQQALLSSFQQTGVMPMAGSDRSGFQPDYELAMDIRAFQAVYAAGGGLPTAEVRIVARLIRSADRHVIANFTAEASVAAKQNRQAAITKAFDDAFGQVQRDILAKVGKRV